MKTQGQVCAHVDPYKDSVECCNRCASPFNPKIQSRLMSSLLDNMSRPIKVISNYEHASKFIARSEGN